VPLPFLIVQLLPKATRQTLGGSYVTSQVVGQASSFTACFFQERWPCLQVLLGG